jgi:hypothetical protein
LAEGLDVVVCAGLLATELVAGEAEDGEIVAGEKNVLVIAVVGGGKGGEKYPCVSFNFLYNFSRPSY